jgi:paraquat-inducible protein A
LGSKDRDLNQKKHNKIKGFRNIEIIFSTFRSMRWKKQVLLILHLLSLVLLVAGLYKDMLQIDISAHFIVEIKFFRENRSIIGVLQSLWQSANYLPFLLIFVFGIIVPIVKWVTITYLLLAKNTPVQYYKFINTIGKWAMADVFAISIFVAYLGANAMDNTKAVIMSGFYFFTSYVLLSAFITHVLVKMNRGNS